MGWFSDRIDVHFQMYCLNCGYSFYPYYYADAAFGKPPNVVFAMFSGRECPDCKGHCWERNL